MACCAGRETRRASRAFGEIQAATRYCSKPWLICPPDITAKVVFVGDGEERAALAAYARELKIDGRVIFAGYRRNTPAIMAACRTCWQSHQTKRVSSIVILEAMAVGCPIIGSTARFGAIPAGP